MRYLNECMICSGTNFSPYKNGAYGKEIYICDNCTLVFTNPQPDFAELLKKYGEEYYSHWITPDQQTRRIGLWNRRLKIVKKFIRTGKLIDVGCGEGLFIYCAGQQGYDVSGVEISDFAVQYAKEKFKLNIINSKLEESNLPENSFDIITFWHVLEHLSSPDITLKEAYRILKPGGFLFLSTPNIEDLIGQEFYRLINGHYFQISTPESQEPHLYHFSAKTLSILAKRCNFKIRKTGTDFCQVDPYWRIVECVSYIVSKLLNKNWQLANLLVAQK